jgi:hypothetical protein
MKETIETQVCTTCGLEKPLSEYYFRNDTQKYHKQCKACVDERSKEYARRNREKVASYKKNYRKNNIEKIKAKDKKYREANLEKVRANCKKWYKNNSEKAKLKSAVWAQSNPQRRRETQNQWGKNNPEKRRAYNAKRRAAKLQATPVWADLQKIQEIYLNCPPGHHVDHIFPLKSDKMCGLHVENNLQYLPAKENISKGNRVSLEKQLTG